MARLRRRRVPVRVALQLTKYCNMRCSYCYTNFQTYEGMEDLSKEEFFRLIDQLYDMGTRWIWFLGGEPMLYRDFEAVIDYVHAKGMFCDMNSNGVSITEQNIHVAKKLDAVCISIDGSAETNDHYRGKGAYQKAVAAVRLLQKHGVKVRLHAILTRTTRNTLPDMIALAKETGSFFNYCEVVRKETEPDHVLPPEEYRAFYEAYRAARERGEPIMHSLQVIDYMRKWPKPDSTRIFREEAPGWGVDPVHPPGLVPRRGEKAKDGVSVSGQAAQFPQDRWVKCLSGDLQCFIDLDGRVYACNGTWEHGLNYREVGLRKAWDYLKDRACVSCRTIGLAELHLLLGLNVRSIFHAAKNLLSLQKSS
jgi:MoaA/NifB/PqqE/SkfB family radical SAM enzyme